MNHFNDSIKMIRKIKANGYEIEGKIFFEVGTGRAPLLPIVFCLCGAAKTITVDLHPYMKNEIVFDALEYIRNHTDEIEHVFGELLKKERLQKLIDCAQINKSNTRNILQLCNIEYHAPMDASKTGLEDNSIDFHISYTVYEHIPLAILKDILLEGNRIVKPNGLFVNGIDYSDHFSHSDTSLSYIHFLQYSDEEWNTYAGNRYMYMNRARHDDYLELFDKVGHELIDIETTISNESRQILENKQIAIHDKFKDKSIETLSIIGSLCLTKNKLKQIV